MGYIYKITNLINNKVYIGQTSRQIEIRWSEHIRHGFNPNDKGYSRHLYRSMRKYGLDSFSIDIIESCDNDLMSDRETFWIKFYNSSNPDCGYNLTLGGEGTVLIDYDEVYKKYDAGLPLGVIAKEMNISRSNLTQILKGYENYDKCTAWERAMEEVSLNKGNRVSQYDLHGNFINTFQSSKVAARSVPNTTRANIMGCCKNKRGTSGGFQWRFENDDPPCAYNGPSMPKAVCQLDLCGNVLAEFQSISMASKATGVERANIAKCCNNLAKTACGYMWRYKNEMDV